MRTAKGMPSNICIYIICIWHTYIIVWIPPYKIFLIFPYYFFDTINTSYCCYKLNLGMATSNFLFMIYYWQFRLLIILSYLLLIWFQYYFITTLFINHVCVSTWRRNCDNCYCWHQYHHCVLIIIVHICIALFILFRL